MPNNELTSVTINGERFVRETPPVVVAPAYYKVGQKVKVTGMLGRRPKHPLGTGEIVRLVKDFDGLAGIVIVRFPNFALRRVFNSEIDFAIRPSHNLKVVA